MSRRCIYPPPGGFRRTISRPCGENYSGDNRPRTVLERWDTPRQFLELHRLSCETERAHASCYFTDWKEAFALIMRRDAQRSSETRVGRRSADFRSCRSKLNRTRRFYHSGETTESLLSWKEELRGELRSLLLEW